MLEREGVRKVLSKQDGGSYTSPSHVRVSKEWGSSSFKILNILRDQYRAPLVPHFGNYVPQLPHAGHICQMIERWLPFFEVANKLWSAVAILKHHTPVLGDVGV